MYCSNCGKEIKEKVQFCPSCGKPVHSLYSCDALIIERKTQDSAMKYKMSVRINGGIKYNLMPGERVEIPLNKGKHILEAALNLNKKTLTIDFPADSFFLISYGLEGTIIENPNKREEISKDDYLQDDSKMDMEQGVITNQNISSQEFASVQKDCPVDSTIPSMMNKTEECNDDSDKSSTVKTTSAKTTSGKISISGIITIAVLIGIIIYAVNFVSHMFISKESECKTAEKEVKAVILENYGEIPDVESECLYDGGSRVIIIVKFKLPELGFDGSYAVIVSDKNPIVHGMTSELDYSYDYESVLEELKTLYQLD